MRLYTLVRLGRWVCPPLWSLYHTSISCSFDIYYTYSSPHSASPNLYPSPLLTPNPFSFAYSFSPPSPISPLNLLFPSPSIFPPSFLSWSLPPSVLRHWCLIASCSCQRRWFCSTLAMCRLILDWWRVANMLASPERQKSSTMYALEYHTTDHMMSHDATWCHMMSHDITWCHMTSRVAVLTMHTHTHIHTHTDLPQAPHSGEVCGGPSSSHPTHGGGEGVHHDNKERTPGGVSQGTMWFDEHR